MNDHFKIMRSTGFILLLGMILTCRQKDNVACKSPECHRQEKYDSVMTMHNEIMKKMPVLNDLLQQINTINKKEPDSVATVYWSRIANELVVADSRMWDWMHNFDPVTDTMTDQEAVHYLDKQYWVLYELDQQFDSTTNMAGKALEGRNRISK